MTITSTEVNRDLLLKSYRRRLGRGQARLAEFLGAPVEVSSNGARVRTAEGREILDCGGYAVFFVGHGHPRIREAVIEQLQANAMATRLLLEPRVAQAAELLGHVTPPNLNYVQFTNSGAEATELGLKIARANGKNRLIATHSGYHGKTLGALSVTENARFQDPFRPLLETTYVPFGQAGALEVALAAGAQDACVILEPIQGEGGVNLPPIGYLAEVQRLCRRYGAMLIVDEIQTGLGRCGQWWASYPEINSADVLLVGKALSGGMIPVAGVVATEEALGHLGDDPTLHTSTYAASPVAMAAAAETIQVIEDENLVTRSAQLGDQLLFGLTEELSDMPGVVDIRGQGLLIGIEFSRPDLVAEVVADLLDTGILANHSLSGRSVLRLTPPAVLETEDLDRMVATVTDSVRRQRRKS